MKKEIISLLFSLILIIGLIVTYQDVESKTKNHAMTTTELNMIVKDKTSLNIPGVKAKKVKWKSSKKSVASISKSGVVSALKAGKTKITGTYKGIKFYCNVTVETKNTNLYNKTIYDDEQLKIVLKSISTKKIAFTVYNKTNQLINIGPTDYLKLDSKAYYPTDFCVVWPVAPGASNEIISSINVDNPDCTYISLNFMVIQFDNDISIVNAKVK